MVVVLTVMFPTTVYKWSGKAEPENEFDELSSKCSSFWVWMNSFEVRLNFAITTQICSQSEKSEILHWRTPTTSDEPQVYFKNKLCGILSNFYWCKMNSNCNSKSNLAVLKANPGVLLQIRRKVHQTLANTTSTTLLQARNSSTEFVWAQVKQGWFI